MWQDRSGKLFTFKECESEYALYKAEKGLAALGGKPPVQPVSSLRRTFQRVLDMASKTKHQLLD